MDGDILGISVTSTEVWVAAPQQTARAVQLDQKGPRQGKGGAVEAPLGKDVTRQAGHVAV
ncbi:MAG: hypothetical protein WBA16_06095 [Nonlabens sp.]